MCAPCLPSNGVLRTKTSKFTYIINIYVDLKTSFLLILVDDERSDHIVITSPMWNVYALVLALDKLFLGRLFTIEL